MVLYHVITSYHLLNALTHHSKMKTKATLIMPHWFLEKFESIDYLYECFDKVIITDVHYRFNHTQEDTVKYFRTNIGDMNQFSEIYVWGAQYSFGIYLAEQNIKFIFCEEGAGILTRPEILEHIDYRLKEKYFTYIKKLGLFNGKVLCAEKVLCNIKAQKTIENREKIIDFDVINVLKSFSIEERGKIISFFSPIITVEIRKERTCLLTQQFTSLQILSFEKQILIYQMLVDYFFENQELVIKPHPDDLMYYSQLFPEAQIIREKFPSEFLPFILSEQPECVATISSTAIFNLRGHYPKVFELDTRYEQDFEMTHRYYSAACIAKKLNLDIVCIGANDILMKRLCEVIDADNLNISSEMTENYSNALIVVDNVTALGEEGRKQVINVLLNLPKNACVAFINSQEDYCWYSYGHKNLWDKMIPIVLQKSKLERPNEDFYASLEDEVVYIYSDNEELLSVVKEMNIEKTLSHTGVKVSKVTLSPEQEKIKMLEGILAATERRLLYYIEKEKKNS